MKMLKRLLKEEKGQGLVEYALIIALVAVAIITAVTLLGTQIGSVFTYIKNKLSVPAT